MLGKRQFFLFRERSPTAATLINRVNLERLTFISNHIQRREWQKR